MAWQHPHTRAFERKLSRMPQTIDEENWYYEHRSHILLVHEVRTADSYIRTDQIKIPWKMIERSRRRKPVRSKKVTKR